MRSCRPRWVGGAGAARCTSGGAASGSPRLRRTLAPLASLPAISCVYRPTSPHVCAGLLRLMCVPAYLSSGGGRQHALPLHRAARHRLASGQGGAGGQEGGASRGRVGVPRAAAGGRCSCGATAGGRTGQQARVLDPEHTKRPALLATARWWLCGTTWRPSAARSAPCRPPTTSWSPPAAWGAPPGWPPPPALCNRGAGDTWAAGSGCVLQVRPTGTCIRRAPATQLVANLQAHPGRRHHVGAGGGPGPAAGAAPTGGAPSGLDGA